MQDDEFKRELERLAERLARIERLLQIEPEREVPPLRAPSIIIQPVAPKPAPPPLFTEPPMQPISASASIPNEPEAAQHVAGANKSSVFQRLHPAPGSSPVHAPAPGGSDAADRAHQAMTHGRAIPPFRSRPANATPLELLIGGKWMAWVGAITVVLAAAFAVMVGVKEGWWGHISPLIRCLSIACVGGLLLIGGEIALRWFGKAASVGLFGAGLGTLYLDSFAAFKPFNLVSEIGAFPLLTIVALLGFVITVRTRFLTIGVLSLMGGYLAPLLLWESSSAHALRIPMHITMLFGIALGLSAARPANFRALRYVALGGQLVIGLIWILGEAPTVWKPAMVFMSIWAAMLLAEIVLAALREQSARGNVVVSLLGTASFVTAGCWLLNQFQPAGFNWMGAFTVAIGVLNAAAAAQFGPGLDALRGQARSAMDKLAIALWIQAGVLLATAIALQFDGFGQSIGWLAVGLAGIEIGRRLPSRGVTVFGLIVGSLALLRVTLFDWWITPGMDNTIWSFGQVQISNWSLLALLAIAVLHIAARRVQGRIRESWAPVPVVLAVLATLLWMAVCAVQCNGLSATAGWLLGGAALLAAERFGRRQKYFEIALLVLLATAARWLMLDAILSRMAPRWSALDSLPVLNWQMALAGAIAAAGWWAYRVMRSRQQRSAHITQSPFSAERRWQIVIVVGGIFGLIALSFETDHLVTRLAAVSTNLWWSVGHLRQLLLTLLWTFGSTGVGVLALAMRQHDEHGRIHVPQLLMRFAWGVLLIAAIKWIFGDTLYWVFASHRSQVIGSLPLANWQMLVGLMLAVAAMVLAMADSRQSRWPPPAFDVSAWIPVMASILVLWGLTFEIDRALGRIVEMPNWLAAWHPIQVRGLWWTALWSIGGLAMLLVGRWRRLASMVVAGWSLTAGAAAAWLTFDTLIWRFNVGIAHTTVVANLQFIVGILVAAMLGITTQSIRKHPPDVQLFSGDRLQRDLRIGLGLITAIGLWAGTLEIDRFFASDPMQQQTGFSVYWGLYAVMLIMLGFLKRMPAARYLGMALLGITLVKAFTIDMREVKLIWRTLIFAVIGMLLIGTSIVYVRLAPRLFKSPLEDESEGLPS